MAHAGLGEIYARQGKVPEANAEYGEAAKADPTKAAMYLRNQAVIFFQANNAQAQIAAAKGGHHTVPDDVLPLIPMLDPISQEKLWLLADQKLHIKERTTRNHCNILMDEHKIFVHRIPRPGTKHAVGYAQTPPPTPSI